MYNDRIDVSNKIITADDLYEIITLMNEKLVHYQKIFQKEEKQNEMYEYKYQVWTFKDYSSSLKFYVDFYDDTNIHFDSYGEFINVFNMRLRDIKSFDVHFCLNYSTYDEEHGDRSFIQRIDMNVYESKMRIDAKLSSEDDKISDVYNLIKNKVLNAPIKYDDVIKKRNKYINTVGFAIGFIPAIIIVTLLMFVEPIRIIFIDSYVLYPIACLILTAFIGGTIGSSMLGKLYVNILPEKKYAGYDSYSSKSIYEDDIESFVGSSEILIGRKRDNLNDRKEIEKIYNKYKKWLPYELVTAIVFTLIVILLGLIF